MEATMPDTTDIDADPRDSGDRAEENGAGTLATDAERVRFARVSESLVSVEECVTAVEGPGSGAVVTFAGVVRDHDEGRGVTALSYSAHPSAGDVIRTVALEIARAHPAVVLAVAHRVGDLGIGDVALACAAASAHRAEAFAACAALVDAVKATVPIWKEQAFDDGTTEWVASIG
jgi:molybdopterin synthase catalytic subunit